ncbi:Hypothetical protein GSB_154030 [Giardia duodenalis]|uniref:Eukaryotic translation initiation factor 3 subunit G N-terminal domain-containing protein n=2 Tax=Giardia intestinalis TaxID=5741 RepID=V6TRR5_GIAIN|nr:Hypothetical protein GSB_154030 [Giardia intestinalis]
MKFALVLKSHILLSQHFFYGVMDTDPYWTRLIDDPVGEDGTFISRKFTLQEDRESVLVNEKLMQQESIVLEVPIRVKLRREAITKAMMKNTKYYQPNHYADSGHSNVNIVVSEERPISLDLNSESAQKQQRSTALIRKSMDKTHVKCTNCGGYHYTYACPQRETYKRDIITEKGGIYVPPSKRNGADKQTYSLKLDPVPHFWTRENLQKLVDSLCEELRNMLKGQQSGGDDRRPTEKLTWRDKVRIAKEQKEAQARVNEPAPVPEQEPEPEKQEEQTVTTEPQEDKQEAEPEPEDEQITSLRAAINGLRLERASFPTSRIDGRRQGYAYINLGTKEAQQLFKARWDGARIASEQTIMHVLLPEEYAPTRK